MRTAVVTDSTSDLPKEVLSAYQIHSIPAILIIDGQSLVDGVGITREQFYQQLPTMKTHPSTATPSSGAFEEAYRQLLNHGVDHIVSLHPPAKLSGVYNSALVAAKRFGSRVTVLDSGSVTLSLGFQAIAAAEAASQDLPLDQILAKIASTRERTHLLAMLDTLEYVRRSGRVSWAGASLGTVLQIKPFLTIKDGDVLRLGQARTRHKGLERLYASLEKLGKLERLAILHTAAEADARQMHREFSAQAKTETLIVNVTTVIGTHVGPNALGFVAVVE
jgi:DegV family protein with EDD domain